MALQKQQKKKDLYVDISPLFEERRGQNELCIFNNRIALLCWIFLFKTSSSRFEREKLFPRSIFSKSRVSQVRFYYFVAIL